ncbi:NicO-domain-containing protein [Basidiobolus meristosporus CBS 931.73]|uniref:Nickel/cobalt efflux system n=1 Tax=Basidiobolus meristosporus CBS 931.73 TaxID=1314790 RepID=A0A1Y1XYH5_9FUNG|nr:NicO-domain-containing protein [Basidiobolus meristosporus CBS 931.73]|eukprot:ORX90807.1 NicO-domain-containing protein [Basidiobolus meristosporus CBS 931.73]
MFALRETRTFKQKLIPLFLFLASLNIGIWVAAGIALIEYDLIGEEVLACNLGLSHASNADHIAAVDNVTHKLIQSGKRPCLIVFFFSIDYSTVVVCASIAVAATATVVASKFPSFETVGGIIGTVVSGIFYLLIGIMNAVAPCGLWK